MLVSGVMPILSFGATDIIPLLCNSDDHYSGPAALSKNLLSFLVHLGGWCFLGRHRSISPSVASPVSAPLALSPPPHRLPRPSRGEHVLPYRTTTDAEETRRWTQGLQHLPPVHPYHATMSSGRYTACMYVCNYRTCMTMRKGRSWEGGTDILLLCYTTILPCDFGVLEDEVITCFIGGRLVEKS